MAGPASKTIPDPESRAMPAPSPAILTPEVVDAIQSRESH
jgi:hypothetical protein